VKDATGCIKSVTWHRSDSKASGDRPSPGWIYLLNGTPICRPQLTVGHLRWPITHAWVYWNIREYTVQLRDVFTMNILPNHVCNYRSTQIGAYQPPWSTITIMRFARGRRLRSLGNGPYESVNCGLFVFSHLQSINQSINQYTYLWSAIIFPSDQTQRRCCVAHDLSVSTISKSRVCTL